MQRDEDPQVREQEHVREPPGRPDEQGRPQHEGGSLTPQDEEPHEALSQQPVPGPEMVVEQLVPREGGQDRRRCPVDEELSEVRADGHA